MAKVARNVIVLFICMGACQLAGQQIDDSPTQAESPLAVEAVDPPERPRSTHSHEVDDETLVSFLGDVTKAITDTSEQIATQALWVQIFITVLVALFGFYTVLWQHNTERRAASERERLERQLETRLATTLTEIADLKRGLHLQVEEWRREAEVDLRERIAQAIPLVVTDNLATHVEELFKARYDSEIKATAVAYVRDVLLQTPEARDFLLARLRRAVREVCAALANSADGDVRQIRNAFSGAVRDWHALGQLFSTEEEQLHRGLLAVQANPFPEAKKQLDRLRVRCSDQAAAVALIDAALKKVEQLWTSPM